MIRCGEAAFLSIGWSGLPEGTKALVVIFVHCTNGPRIRHLSYPRDNFPLAGLLTGLQNGRRHGTGDCGPSVWGGVLVAAQEGAFWCLGQHPQPPFC